MPDSVYTETKNPNSAACGQRSVIGLTAFAIPPHGSIIAPKLTCQMICLRFETTPAPVSPRPLGSGWETVRRPPFCHGEWRAVCACFVVDLYTIRP